jgi:hypothetical protein
LLLSHFLEEKKFYRNVGTYKIRELPWHNALGFFHQGRSLKIHIEIKRELFIMTLGFFPPISQNDKKPVGNLLTL